MLITYVNRQGTCLDMSNYDLNNFKHVWTEGKHVWKMYGPIEVIFQTFRHFCFTYIDMSGTGMDLSRRVWKVDSSAT